MTKLLKLEFPVKHEDVKLFKLLTFRYKYVSNFTDLLMIFSDPCQNSSNEKLHCVDDVDDAVITCPWIVYIQRGFNFNA